LSDGDGSGPVYVLHTPAHLAFFRLERRVRFACDALATSPYKWYGPHAGVLVLEPELLASIAPYKVRPAKDTGPGRLETGTPSFEAIAGIEAAARFLLDTGMEAIATAESSVFEALLDGLRALPRVTIHGPPDLADRTPTVLFSVEGVHADDVARALADAQVAVWAGHSYAVEASAAMGLDADAGVGVRAGVVAYVNDTDAAQLLEAVSGL